jgi:5-formyltetrahydrofolate cyclo-ligase
MTSTEYLLKRHKKEELRKEIKLLKNQFNQKELEVMSETTIQKLKCSLRFKLAKTIMMYYSLPDEVNTHDFINKIAIEKNVVLPVVIDNENIELRIFHNSKEMKPGAYNIMEPTGSAFNSYEIIDVAVIPGIAFDCNCHRLGRGKGYYDRFLKKIPNAYKIGICFNFQKVENVPSSEFDINMDEVIS